MKNLTGLINNDKAVLSLLVFLFLFLRLSILLTDVKNIEMNEETVCGVFAHDLLHDDLKLPFHKYQHVEWCGDTLMDGVLAVPLFALLGESIVTLKLIPLFFSLGTLVLWYMFLKRFVNRNIAILTALLFILSPVYFTRLGLIAAIPHTELNFFSIAAVYCFFKFISSKGDYVSLVLFGLISGIGIYCHYLFLITLACCFLFWFVSDRWFFIKKTFVTFILFLTLGLIPWIITNIYNYPYGLPILRGHFNPVLHLKKFLRLISYNIPHSLGFDYVSLNNGIVFSFLYYAVFVLCFIIGMVVLGGSG